MLKERSEMHEEHAHDYNLIAMETSNPIHTRDQLRAAENAFTSHVVETDDLNDNANSPLRVRNDTPALPAVNEARENVTLLLNILLPRATSGNDVAAARPSVAYDEDGIDLHANLAVYNELKIPKALARHSVEIGPPKHYAPNHLVPGGKMRVVGIRFRLSSYEPMHFHYVTTRKHDATANICSSPVVFIQHNGYWAYRQQQLGNCIRQREQCDDCIVRQPQQAC